MNQNSQTSPTMLKDNGSITLQYFDIDSSNTRFTYIYIYICTYNASIPNKQKLSVVNIIHIL